MGFIEHQTGFIGALRAAGLPVSVSESIDAARAMEQLELLDREQFREGAAAALVKSSSNRAAFDALFDLWYPSATGVRQGTSDEAAERTGTPGREDQGAQQIRDALRRALLDPPSAETDSKVRAAARQATVRFGRGSRQDAWLASSAISAIAPQTLMAGLLAELLGEPGAPQRTALAERVERTRIRALIELFEGEVAAEIRRRRSEEIGRDRMAAVVPVPVERIDLNAASREQLAELRRAVAPLARRLAVRLAQRQRTGSRGRVDFRRTVRASLASGGVPLQVIARPRRPHRPEIVVICDLSGSVQPFAQFTLMLIAALRQQFTRVRVFGFIDSLDEITEMLGPEEDVGDALRRVIREAQVVRNSGSTDYGAALRTMVREHQDALTPATSLLILGDARSNYGNPAVDELRAMVHSVRHSFWLNPERLKEWGTGDSVAPRYSEIIEMSEVRDLDQLAAFVERLAVA
ncbi:VWA domain-containing protein [soil metagenome]